MSPTWKSSNEIQEGIFQTISSLGHLWNMYSCSFLASGVFLTKAVPFALFPLSRHCVLLAYRLIQIGSSQPPGSCCAHSFLLLPNFPSAACLQPSPDKASWHLHRPCSRSSIPPTVCFLAQLLFKPRSHHSCTLPANCMDIFSLHWSQGTKPAESCKSVGSEAPSPLYNSET